MANKRNKRPTSERVKNALRDRLGGEVKFDTTNYDDLLAALQTPDDVLKAARQRGYDDPIQYLNDLAQQIQDTSRGSSYLDMLRERIRRGEDVARLIPALRVLNSLAQLGFSLQQIDQSNRELAGIRPVPPPATDVDIEPINQAIRDVRRGSLDAASLLAPYQNIQREQAAVDRANALMMGGGQSGVTASLLQASTNRRARTNQLPAAIAELRRQDQGQLANLLALRQNALQQGATTRAGLYGDMLRDRWVQLNRAGTPGLFGRQNALTALGSLTDNLAAVDWSRLLRRRKRYSNPEIENFDAYSTNALRDSYNSFKQWG